jgi:hypothetical protein
LIFIQRMWLTSPLSPPCPGTLFHLPEVDTSV